MLIAGHEIRSIIFGRLLLSQKGKPLTVCILSVIKMELTSYQNRIKTNMYSLRFCSLILTLKILYIYKYMTQRDEEKKIDPCSV